MLKRQATEGAKDMSVKQYRKKPVVIEALQIEPSTLWSAITEFCPTASIIYPGLREWGKGYSYVEIETLEGTMRADGGDYIIKGVAGEFYPCKPDIFHATYDEVEALSAGDGRPALTRQTTGAHEMQLITTTGKLDGIQWVKISGIVDGSGACVSVKCYDLSDGQPISWAMSERVIEGLSRIVEAQASA